jgi:hypothetical protein
MDEKAHAKSDLHGMAIILFAYCFVFRIQSSNSSNKNGITPT